MAKGLPRVAKNSTLTVPGDFGRVTIPVRNLSLTATAITTANGIGTVVLGDFPDGNILMLGAVSYLRFSTSDANVTSAVWTGSYSIGSAPDADGNQTDTGENDIILAQPLGAATAKVSPYTRGQSGTPGASYPQILNNENGSLEVNLNFFITAAHITDSSSALFKVDGVLHMAYIMLGDN